MLLKLILTFQNTIMLIGMTGLVSHLISSHQTIRQDLSRLQICSHLLAGQKNLSQGLDYLLKTFPDHPQTLAWQEKYEEAKLILEQESIWHTCQRCSQLGYKADTRKEQNSTLNKKWPNHVNTFTNCSFSPDL